MGYQARIKNKRLILSDTPGGNYEKKLEEFPLPKVAGLFDVIVQHDSWCRMLRGRGACNCNPVITKARKREL